MNSASLAAAVETSRPLRIGFLGRVSSKEKQDPSLSIPRQYRGACSFAEKQGWTVEKSCWDIESGRTELGVRGHGAEGAIFGIDVPRDGGLPELVAFARSGQIDAVLVESIDRLSRITADSTAIERELGRYDVPIFACDEPVNLNATAILTRRVKQGIAEFYIADLLEKSRRGMEESVHQGWHTGGPIPYGYRGERHRHPNPHKASEGATKTRLVPCSERGAVVKTIFHWYCVEHAGLGEIVERLNKDHDRYPPPARSGRASRDLAPKWSKATVQSILRNPKYTGFNVWNRHDKRVGRPSVRAKEQWVWSDDPTHEPLVSRELFEQVEDQAKANEKRSKAGGLQRHAPTSRERPGRFYPMRGLCVCELCEHRMQGSNQKNENYMRCLWGSGRDASELELTNHPTSLQVKESYIIDSAIDFLARRVFSPAAIQLFHEQIGKLEETMPAQNRAEKMTRLRKQIDELQRAIDKQVLTFEQFDTPKHPAIVAAIKRIEEIDARRVVLVEALEAIEAEDRADTAKPSREQIAGVLETLPDLRAAMLSYTPEKLADLFDAMNLRARWNHNEKTLHLSVGVFPGLAEVLASDEPVESADRRIKWSIAGAGFEPATSGL